VRDVAGSLYSVLEQTSLNGIILNDKNLRAPLGVIIYGHLASPHAKPKMGLWQTGLNILF
jgi:hypothetical protein